MSMKLLGRATIKVNGTAFRTKPGAQFDPGGTTRTTRVGHEVHDDSEAGRQGSLEAEIDYDAETSVADINAIEDATVVFECDTGQTYVGNHWWSTGESTLTDGPDSTVPIKFEGPAAEEMK